MRDVEPEGAGGANISMGVSQAKAELAHPRPSGLRKAAILMMGLDEAVSAMLFQSLDETSAQKITEEIAGIGGVNPHELTNALAEFHGLLEEDSFVMHGGRDSALRLLRGAFGDVRAKEMVAEAHAGKEMNDGALGMLRKMAPVQLGKLLENEHPRTLALVLSQLDAEQGATVLMQLEPKVRMETVRRMAQRRQHSPEVAMKVLTALSRRMESTGLMSPGSEMGSRYAAEMLGRLDPSIATQILEAIDEDEPDVATGLRALLFDFEEVLRVPLWKLRDAVNAADKQMLARAMQDASENTRAYLFQAMDHHGTEMLKADIDALGTVQAEDVAAAQQAFLALARKVETEGRSTQKVRNTLDVTH